jgi:hypothetical protein
VTVVGVFGFKRHASDTCGCGRSLFEDGEERFGGRHYFRHLFASLEMRIGRIGMLRQGNQCGRCRLAGVLSGSEGKERREGCKKSFKSCQLNTGVLKSFVYSWGNLINK